MLLQPTLLIRRTPPLGTTTSTRSSGLPRRRSPSVGFVARFLGRELRYIYAITAFEPDVRLVMATSEGPFPMETTYTWEDEGAGATRMTLRNRGQPAGFSKLASPLMVPAMRRANRRDLASLKRLLEAS
jgi:hypothetical protein